MYQLYCHLSQMHIMNYARFIREKQLIEKSEANGGGAPTALPSRLESATDVTDRGDMHFSGCIYTAFTCSVSLINQLSSDW